MNRADKSFQAWTESQFGVDLTYPDGTTDYIEVIGVKHSIDAAQVGMEIVGLGGKSVARPLELRPQQ